MVIVLVSSATRVILFFLSIHDVDPSLLTTAGIFAVGLGYDVINAGYVIIPLLLFMLVTPSRLYKQTWFVYLRYITLFLFTFLALFNAVSEYFFWDEFHTRYNFIAVDYLIYTTEVLGNIRESYPIEWILLTLAIISVAITYLLKPAVAQLQSSGSNAWKVRARYLLVLSVFPLFSFLCVDNTFHHLSNNPYVNELAGNGLYELFAAYRNNELSYDQFYKRLDYVDVNDNLRSLIKTPDSRLVSSQPASVDRYITSDGIEKRLNVVMISVESFSADFMHHFGNPKEITPFLDSLYDHSLVFTNLYATGTRTVRGLEALSLAVPPTPGQSIVRRPNNEDLFTLGTVFRNKGYETQYIYGGYGYFDNMNYFFDHNGYHVVDRTAIPDGDIDYENIWGVADENLFDLAFKEIEKDYSSGKPFFAQVMTTSNHRPFTYPDGRIDIPSHSGRDGAVKYTDYAIGRFITEAKTKPWFDNTLFVIVADHCASSAGKTELPIEGYHIPMLVYAPSHVKAGVMDRLMSQVDIAPTLLGMLNFSYRSKFYGYDIFRLERGRERAFISTYQKLGYLKDSALVILSPQQGVEVQSLSTRHSIDKAEEQRLTDEAISWYQAASYAFQHGLMKE
ncbi:MAG: LTA synthase family protein [Cyclobacteriaceae bacterium]|nr:LTA synthase family protein [Cyclobacteriaceae bacterium]